MRKALILLLCVACCACAPKVDNHDAEIRTALASRFAEQPSLSYELTSYAIIDTITYGDMCAKLAEVDRAQFKKQRNQEFTTFRLNGKEYERDVMRGRLKDKSEWLTEIRTITERADAILASFDNVKKYNYEYQYLSAWYNARFYNFYGYEQTEQQYKELRKFIEENAELFANSEELDDVTSLTPYQYKIAHKYSVVNPFGGGARIDLEDEITLNANFELVE